MFKIAYCAGHYLGTPGKRVPKALDPNQTREWTLNDRVARYFNEAALQYEGVQTLRTDDSTGKKHISIKKRTAKANSWGADIYIDIHHNAGINLGYGGGVVAYSYPGSFDGKLYRNEIYKSVIEAGKLKGNRAEPLQEKAYDSLKYAAAPAVLIEYGFMDSRTDYPIISTEEYARSVGYATMDGIAKVKGLKKIKDNLLTVDGKWGSETTRRLQEIFNTPADGIVSNQLEKYRYENPGLVSGWDWQDEPNGNGSKLIRVMQKWAGMSSFEVDGIFGTDTIKAFQKKLGTPVDGKVSNPSQMVKALQRWANDQ